MSKRGISRRTFVQAGALAAAGAALFRKPAAGAAPRKGPNLVYVFPDQFRPFAMGFMGADPVQTPNLDRFAGESVVFSNAVSNYPVCSPHRAMLLTGRWPHSTGVTTNCNSGRPEVFLKPSERCFTDVLAEAGYCAGYLGKWHLDAPTEEDARYGEGKRGNGVVWDAYTPPNRRHGITFWHAYGCCDKHLHPHYWVGDAPVSQPIQVEEWSSKHETDVAVDYILNRDGKQRDPNRPFALFVAFNPPHPPYNQEPEEYRTRYAGKTPEELLNRPNVPPEGKDGGGRRAVADYFSAVTGVDDQFGRILKAIDDAGLKEDTIVVFSSDHGEMMGSQGRMQKGVIYEESFRIPFIMRYPGRLKPGTDPLHLNVPDFMPTLLSLMGLGDRIPKQVEGTDRSQTILTRAGERPTSTFFLVVPGRPDEGSRGIRTDHYTFAVTRGGGADGQALLFDRQNDPYEMKNLAGEQPEVCKQLAAELNGWLRKTHDPFPEVEWPLRVTGAFPVLRQGEGCRIDFEDAPGAAQMASPASSFAALTEKPGEVLDGKRSLLCDTRASNAQFHECLRLTGLLQPGKEYEVTYRYRVLASGEKTQFYTVVRSTADINRKAARLYWSEPPGEAKTRTFRFKTEDVTDHHLLFGVSYQGAIVIDDIAVSVLPGG